jgi:hypothetical protein
MRPTSVAAKRVLPPARVSVTLPERPRAVIVVPSVGGSRYGPSRNTAGLRLKTAKSWSPFRRVLDQRTACRSRAEEEVALVLHGVDGLEVGRLCTAWRSRDARDRESVEPRTMVEPSMGTPVTAST